MGTVERLCDCSRTWGLEGSSPIQLQTKTSMILACGSAEHGVEMHCLAVKLGIESDVYVATSVLTMYSNRGELVSAAKVFEEMPTKNVKMRGCTGENPNSVTLISVVSACASLSYLRFGKQVHGLIVKIKIGLDVVIGTALVDAYAIFKELDEKSVVPWPVYQCGNEIQITTSPNHTQLNRIKYKK
ncbi:hypothetical protein TB2_011238 [Malus domestica]